MGIGMKRLSVIVSKLLTPKNKKTDKCVQNKKNIVPLRGNLVFEKHSVSKLLTITDTPHSLWITT